MCRGKLQPSHRRRRLQLLGPGVTSAPTSAGYLAAPRRLSVLEKFLQTILALQAAVKLAAIINSPADGWSASAICLMGQASIGIEQSPSVHSPVVRLTSRLVGSTPSRAATAMRRRPPG